MASNQETPVLKRKYNVTSWVWTYFEKQNQKAFCKLCNSFVNWNKNSSSQLGWHLNSSHKIYKSTNPNSATESNQNDLNAETEDEEEVPDQMNAKKKKTINESLVNYLVQSNLPMSTVNNDSFKKFIKNLSPDYTLPSRGFLTYNLIPEKVTVFNLFTLSNYCKLLFLNIKIKLQHSERKVTL